MSKKLKRITLISVLGGAACYAFMHRDELMDTIDAKKAQTKESFDSYKNDISKVANSSKKFQDTSERLNEAIANTLPIVDSISERIEKFSIEIDPTIEKIDRKLESFR